MVKKFARILFSNDEKFFVGKNVFLVIHKIMTFYDSVDLN